jgi:serine/threonine protein kinase
MTESFIIQTTSSAQLLEQKSCGIWPKITDFGLAQRVDRKEPLVIPIQPPQYHAPEVLLGTGLSYSAGIWNFGLLVRRCDVLNIIGLAINVLL